MAEIGLHHLADSPAARFVPPNARLPLAAVAGRYDVVAGRHYVGTFNSER